jgi:D-alanine-D-alanine ligase
MSGVVLNKSRLRGNIAVLMGGSSAEREVSLQSGKAVVEVFKEHTDRVVAIDPARENLIDALGVNAIAHVFIALHGRGGEDGTLQGFLDLQGITYTGSGVLASALAMDKLRCKQLWKGVGLPTADFAVLNADSDWNAIIDRLGETLMVKPASEGSSIGMARVAGAGELQAAYKNAVQYDDVVIAESWINGAEYTVAFLGDQAQPVIKLETDNSFYDYDAKYISSQTRYLCPCGLDAQQEKQLKQLAKAAYDSLGCRGWGRVDLMADSRGEFFLLEVNTVPGMTSHSLVPMAAKANGYSFSDLVLTIFNQSV